MDADFEDDDDQEKKAPKFPISQLTSEGSKYFNLGLFEKAIASFNTALVQDPKNADSLIGLGKCYLRLNQLEKAKTAAEAALAAKPKSPEASLLKGDVDYWMGNFEKSFITYHRGHVFRPNYRPLKLGYQTCRSAIDNALHPDEDMVLEDEDVADMIDLLDENPKTHQTHSRALGKSKMFEQDIDCLETILSDDTMQSVHPDCEELLDFLKLHREFWSYHQPVTTRADEKTEEAPTDELPEDDETEKTVESVETQEAEVVVQPTEPPEADPNESQPEVAAEPPLDASSEKCCFSCLLGKK